MKRRSFIRHTTHAIGISALLGPMGFSSFARSLAKTASDNNKALVLIYLQGGNDGLNTVIPLDQLSALNAVRSNIVIPENKLLTLQGTQLGLHPKLEGLQSLFNEERLRIIQSVGYPEPNYSHFRSTDIWMSGANSNEILNSGWSGRFLDHEFPGYPENYPNETNSDPLAIEIGYGSTMLFQGPAAAMSMVIKDPTNFYSLVENVEQEFPDTNAGDKLEHINLIAKQSQLYGEVVKQAAETIQQQQPFPESGLAQQLKIVSRLIAGGLKTPLYLVRMSGFDTHDNQVVASDHSEGEHAELMAELNGAIMAFMQDLEFQGCDDDVVGMTFSEFGRRIISNASSGTDHGAAAPMFIFGNNVEQGVLGENPVIPPDATSKDNLQWQYDFRQVYASLLEQWFELGESSLNSILLDDFNTVPVIKSVPVAASENFNLHSNFKVYPNPLNNIASVSFISAGISMQINAIDIHGKVVSQIFSGTPFQGKQKVQWNTSHLPVGSYYVVFRSEKFQQTVAVVKGM